MNEVKGHVSIFKYCDAEGFQELAYFAVVDKVNPRTYHNFHLEDHVGAVVRFLAPNPSMTLSGWVLKPNKNESKQMVPIMIIRYSFEVPQEDR